MDPYKEQACLDAICIACIGKKIYFHIHFPNLYNRPIRLRLQKLMPAQAREVRQRDEAEVRSGLGQTWL